MTLLPRNQVNITLIAAIPRRKTGVCETTIGWVIYLDKETLNADTCIPNLC